MSVKPMRYSRNSFRTDALLGSSVLDTKPAELNVGQKRFPGRAKLKPCNAVYTDGLMPIETISSPGARRSGRTSKRLARSDLAAARLARLDFTSDELDRFRDDGGVEAIEAPDPRRRSEPGELTLGELARREYPAIAQLVAIDFSLEKLPRLAIPDAAHRRQARPQCVAFAQRAQLLDESPFKHRVETFLDAPMQRAPIGRNERKLDEAEGKRCRLCLPEQL